MMSSLLRNHTRIFTEIDFDRKNLPKNGTKLMFYILETIQNNFIDAGNYTVSGAWLRASKEGFEFFGTMYVFFA